MSYFSHASVILPVTNVLKTAEYYRDILGFTISFQWEEPPTYAVVNRDEAVGIHFTESDEILNQSHPKLYIFVHDPDAVFMEFRKTGANIIEPISDMKYGMREFVIEDLNGYKLVIGKGINQ